MDKVKMHQGCYDQERVAKGELEPPAPKCQCKKLIDYAKANELVRHGDAMWVVTKRTRVDVEVDCTMCSVMSDTEKKTCAGCKGTGKIQERRAIDSYNNDIVLTSQRASDPRDRSEKYYTQPQTPRVPTIEEEHIVFAYVEEWKDALQRIKEYASMIQWALQEYGAEVRDEESGEILMEGRPEPKDKRIAHPPGSITFKDGSTNKSWWWEVEGRKNDYGRSI
jgi:hypothetical protein